MDGSIDGKPTRVSSICLTFASCRSLPIALDAVSTNTDSGGLRRLHVTVSVCTLFYK